MNEYQSQILHPASLWIYHYRFNSGDRPFPINSDINRLLTFYPINPAANNEYVHSGYGAIEFSDDEDISEYEEVYNNFYGEPIELDHSYLDMVSNSKKLKVTFEANSTLSYRTAKTSDGDGGFDGDESKTLDYEGSIEGDFDAYYAFILNPPTRSPWLQTLKKDRSSKVSQLNPDVIYGANQKRDGSFKEGIVPYNQGEPFLDTFASLDKSEVGKILPEISFFCSIENMSRSYTSQNGGSVSVSNSMSSFSVEAVFSITIYVSNIVITPSKVYAWIAVGGEQRSTFQTRAFFSRVPLSKVPNNEELKSVGQMSFNFLGTSLPIFAFADKVEPAPSGERASMVTQLSLNGSFNITEEEDYTTLTPNP